VPTVRKPVRAAVALGATAALALAVVPAAAQPGPPVAPPDARLVDVQLLAINDLHGALEPPPGTVEGQPAGGAAYLATLLDRLAEGNRHSFVVHAGDVIGAAPLLSSLFRHEPTIEAMELMGFDVGSVGNHEFDAGFAELQRIIGGGCHEEDGCFLDTDYAGIAPEVFLGANVIDAASGDPVLPPYHVARAGGVRIGFIGLTLEDTGAIVDQSGIEGLEFAEEVETVNRYVDELRAQKVETIVVLIHQGGFAGGGINRCDGGLEGPIAGITAELDDAVDVVVSGHTHQAYVCDVDGTLVTQAGSNGTVVTEINLRVDRRTRDVHTATATNHLVTRDVPVHPEVAELLERYGEEAEELAGRVVGHITGDLLRTLDDTGESTAGNVIADSMLAATAGDATGGAEVAIHNDGGTRADILFARDDDLADGTVTYGDVFAVLPFGNNLVTMTLTGDQLVRVLDQQWQPENERYRPLHVSDGLSITWTSTGDQVWDGEVVEVALHDEPLEADATYRVTTNSFLAGGGSFFSVFTEGTDRRTGVVDVDALEAWIEAQSPLDPPALDEPAELFVQNLELRFFERPVQAYHERIANISRTPLRSTDPRHTIRFEPTLNNTNESRTLARTCP
jgi:5'-nucleotidase